jgi:AraC-like DNA-binding protein/ligand-binding sensor protein
LDDDRVGRQNREIVAQLQKSEIYRAYAEAFQAATGLPLGLRPAATVHSPLQGATSLNPFCAMMRAENESCAACLQLHQQVVDSASISEPRTLECYAGLVESIVPVRVGQNIVAYLQTGQIFLRRPSPAMFRRLLDRLNGWGIKMRTKEIERAYFASQVFSRHHYDSILRMLTIFADHLERLTDQLIVAQSASELPAVAKARRFIAEHQTEVLPLADVARAVNMSGFYFCKTFRRVTGVSFVDYLAYLRVESVKRQLLNPHKRISEAAFAAGFQSLSQFNRVFRRISGESPSVFRHKLQGGGKQPE